jgi:hypothetical protein
MVLARIDETRQPLVVANLLTALMQTLAGSETLAVRSRLIGVLRRLDDPRRLATALSSIAVRYARSGLLREAQDALDEASDILKGLEFLEPSTYESDQLGVDVSIARSELCLAREQFAEARAQIEKAGVIARRLGDDFLRNNLLLFRAEIEFVAGDLARATACSGEVVTEVGAIPRGSALLARALCLHAAIELSSLHGNGGEDLARRALSVTNSVGDDALRLLSLQNVAAAAARYGHPQAGARLLGAVEAWRETTGYRRSRFEEKAREHLLSSLTAQLGGALEMQLGIGKDLPLERAAEQALQLAWHGATAGPK